MAHGGDGTLNEVVNGVLAATDGRPGGPASTVPLVGIVPGGSANVFARALGVPVDPMAATARLLEAVGSRAPAGWSASVTRSPPRAAGRWFTFNAGMGWDAEVVASRRAGAGRGPGGDTAALRGHRPARSTIGQRRNRSSMTVEIAGRGGASPTSGWRSSAPPTPGPTSGHVPCAPTRGP